MYLVCGTFVALCSAVMVPHTMEVCVMMYVLLSIALYLLAFKVLDVPTSNEGDEASSTQEPETSPLPVPQVASPPALQALRSSGSFHVPPD